MEPTPIENVERLRALIETGDAAGIEAFLAPLHTADIADLLQQLDVEEQIVCLKRLDTQAAAEVLAELDAKSGQALLTLLSDHEVGKILEELPSDDAADLISSLTPEKTERVEALLPTADREEIQELLEFGADTAGGLMQVERVAVRDNATIQEAIDVVRRAAEEVESPQRVYVVNEAGKLLGELSILDLVIKPPTARVRDVMQLNAVAVPVDMDQKQVAAMFSKYDEFTMPVVDRQWRLVGRITMDDIIDVMEEETSKDLTRIAGTTDQELGEKSFVRVSGIRLPWLVMGFLGEIVGALIMSRYEAPLRTFVVLAFFIPLIVATAGNHGMQAAIVAVREIALGQAGILHIGRRVLKELQVALLNGIVLGSMLCIFVYMWRGDLALGGLLWISLMLTILVASLIGSAVPLFLHRWKVDPAVATGPFITVSNDVIGMAIYLTLATAYLKAH